MDRQKYIVYVAVSADGYIAEKDGSVGWLHTYPAAVFGFDAFLARVDTVVMGRATFNQALAYGGPWPYENKRVIVLTSKALPREAPSGAEAWRDSVPALKAALGRTNETVWIAGGARTIRSALGHGLVHQFELYVVPRLLGEGIPLFLPGSRPTDLRLSEAAQLPRDVVRLRYEVL
ncbi:MAG: dihydrofolate reductase family protein [bacterium]